MMSNVNRYRKLIYLSVICLFTYTFIFVKKYEVSFSAKVPGVEPNIVWEFVSDFGNMKKLNPTLEEFKITFDENSFDKWTYGVRYTEHLSGIPFIHNYADAIIEVYQDKPKHLYIINSNHKTCFLFNLYCLESNAKFTCTNAIGDKIGTQCREDITYECPRFASFFCYDEVMYQRKAIFKNLVHELKV